MIPAVLLASGSCFGITLMSGPTLTPATNAPLAALLSVTTDVESRISVSVQDGSNLWTRTFCDFSSNHTVPLLGFKAGRTNQILITVWDKLQNAYTPTQPMVFITPPLPKDFPHAVVLHDEPARMEPGYTLCIVQNRTAKIGYLTIIDNLGEVVWYSPAPSTDEFDVRQLPDGNLFMQAQPPLNRFLKLNMLGETVQTWAPPTNYPINDHEGVVTDHGTILYLSDVARPVANFPSNATNSTAALINTNVDDNPVVEISATDGSLLHAWSPLDLLDPARVTYLTYTFKTSFGVDNEHGNAVIEDPTDESLIVSLRNQNAVFKLSRSTGQLKWILGAHENWGPNLLPYLLTPSGTPFEWNYGQHAPELTPQHTLLLYDDGNFRANPFNPPVLDQNNYSRAVEYNIDETNLAVSQVWDSTPVAGDRLFTPAVGDADWLPKTGNILVTYGLISYVNGAHPSTLATNATTARIRELTHDPVPQLVFELSFSDTTVTNASYMGYLCYRSYRIPDLYPHPARPVTDLAVNLVAGSPRLQFSGDPALTYTVEGSANLAEWTSIGTANPGTEPGTFVLQDTLAPGAAARFYRVLTH